jgi:hypothetical protein
VCAVDRFTFPGHTPSGYSKRLSPVTVAEPRRTRTGLPCYVRRGHPRPDRYIAADWRIQFRRGRATLSRVIEGVRPPYDSLRGSDPLARARITFLQSKANERVRLGDA